MAEAGVSPGDEAALVADEQAEEQSRLAAREKQGAECWQPRLWERAVLEGDFRKCRPVAEAQPLWFQKQGEQLAGPRVIGSSDGQVVSHGQGCEELEQALPHVTELPGGVDGLALIHPAVNVVVAGDNRPGESLDGGDVVAALARGGNSGSAEGDMELGPQR